MTVVVQEYSASGLTGGPHDRSADDQDYIAFVVAWLLKGSSSPPCDSDLLKVRYRLKAGIVDTNS